MRGSRIGAENDPALEPELADLGDDRRTSTLVSAILMELRETADKLASVEKELQDESERLQRAQATVRAERRRRRSLLGVASLVTTTAGTILDSDGGAGRLLGVQQRFLVGKPLAAFIEVETRRRFRRRLAHLAEHHEPVRRRLRLARRDGGIVEVDATVTVLAGAEEARSLLWLLQPVTGLVQAGRRTRPSTAEPTDGGLPEPRFSDARALIMRLTEGVIGIDRELEVLFANPSARRLLQPGKLVDGERLPEPWPKLPLEPLARSLFTRRPRLTEVHHETESGLVVAIRGIPALGTGMAGLLVTDTTLRMRHHRAEQDFVANASHELRTPLAAIAGAIEVLQSGAKNDPVERDRFLAHIEREAERLSRLSTALLVLARAQAGTEAARMELVELRPLLEHVAGQLRPAAGVRVELDCPAGLAAFANTQLLEQALLNLGENAVRHTARGTIAIRVAEVDGRTIAIDVHDTGPGIDPEVVTRVTERFFRAVPDGPGFGLGLAIAHEATKALGGRLDLQSQPGQGTTASLRLLSARLLPR